MGKKKIYELSDEEIEKVVGGLTINPEYGGCNSFMVADGMPDIANCQNCYFRHYKNGIAVCDKPTNTK